MATQRNVAQQHTFAVFVLCVTEAVMTVLRPALEQGNQGKQCAKIFRWLNECTAAIPKRHESAGSRRQSTALFRKVAPYFQTEHIEDNHERLRVWVENLWMAENLVADITLGCPEFYRPNKRKFEYLYQTITTLGVRFLEMFPDADERGTERYMQVLEDY